MLSIVLHLAARENWSDLISYTLCRIHVECFIYTFTSIILYKIGLWIIYVISSFFCYAFMRICLLMPCGHLLGKG